MFRTRTVIAVMVLAVFAAACSTSAQEETTASPPTTDLTTTTGAPATITTTTSTTTAPPQSTTVPDRFPVTIDASNGAIEIAEPPTKIVSLSATHTEMLYAIGAGAQVIAVDTFSNYPEEAPRTDLTGFAPNVESITGFDTDLVVTDGDWDGSAMGALGELGVPVLILPAATSLEDVYTQLEQLGAATGNVANAAVLVSQMQTDVDEILSGLPAVEQPITFYHELDATYYSVTSATFIGHLYAEMGLINIADGVADGSSGYPQLSEEYILQQNPDLILLADTVCCAMSQEAIAERPGWETLSAVQGGRVVELNDDTASRWGPRIIDHLRVVADAIAAISVDA